MKQETIGVALIVKNEEIVLARCLDSLKGIDEIVILDTGSTDNTRDVAKKYTDKYIEGVYTWNDNFAEARNKAKSFSTTDWLLGIDADEYLEDGGISKLRSAMVQHSGLKVMNLIVKAEVDGTIHRAPRLRRNVPEIFAKGSIHEYLSLPGQADLDIIVYYGYSPAHRKDPDRALRILTSEIEKNPRAKRERFYLAREYYYRKQWLIAIEHYEIYLKENTWLPERAEAYVRLAECYKYSGDWQKARNACIQAIGINPDFKRALRLMGSLSFPNNKAKWDRIADAAQNEDVLFT
jgi:glycosyltransferase involved in cell wall biosynthesis